MAENPAVESESGVPVAETPTTPAEIISPDLAFVEEVMAAGGESVKKCFQCATCTVVCDLADGEAMFPRKEMLWAGWGLRDRLLADPDLFLCYQCNDCSVQCPRDAKPGNVLAAVRNVIYQRNAVPAFMGKALGNPNAMLALFLFPVLVLLGVIIAQHSGYEGHDGGGVMASMAHLFGSDTVIYHHFLTHKLLESAFIGLTTFFAILACISFVRFYRNLSARYDGPRTMGFIPAAIRTVMEIMLHKRFNTCGQNKPRTAAHMMVLFGFIGAAITTALVIVVMIVNNIQNPGVPFDGLAATSPIKWLGVVSGIAIIVGSLMMMIRKAKDAEAVGADGFGDRLFLWVVLLVSATGMATWLLRLAAIPALAYPMYFVHLVVVGFLLFYLPYSKFAHMIYRSLALVFAHQTGRISK